MLKTNYHTHTVLCKHATGSVMDYVKKASSLGFYELGISDHAPILKTFMTDEEYQANWCNDTMELNEVDEYLKEIKKAKIEYPNMKIYSGFETEFLPLEIKYYSDLRKRVDYLNLGVHYYRWDNKIINSYNELNASNIEGYIKTVEEGLKSGLFTTLVHPDLFFYGYLDENGNHVFDKKCEEVTRRIAELAIQYNVYLEINCNGLKYCKDKLNRTTWLYPCVEFWKIIKEYNVKILVGADAHSVDALANENVRLVFDFIRDYEIPICERMMIRE